MKKNIREKKDQLSKFLHKVIITIIFIFFLINTLNTLRTFTYKLGYPEVYLWNDDRESKGIIIKNEYVVEGFNQFTLDKIATEGTRVAVGDRVAELKSEGNLNYLNNKLKEVNESIKLMEEMDKPQNTGEEVDNSTELSLSKLTLEALKKEKEDLTLQFDNSLISYRADVSGLLTYKIDGYEKELIARNFENYTFEKLQGLFEAREPEETTEGLGIKIIDNFAWYIALQIENNFDKDKYKLNDRITLQITETDIEVEGKLVEINESSSGMVYVIELNKKLHDIYDLRFINANIILTKKDVYKIPTKSIYNFNNQEGVLYKDFIGNIRFKPVVILDLDDEYTIVDKGDENGYIKLKGFNEEYRTITLYDEIILNPKRVKTSTILN